VKRHTISFGKELENLIDQWKTQYNFESYSEAIRVIVAGAMAPHAPAWAAAYEQLLSDLRFRARWILKTVVTKLEEQPAGMYGGHGPYRLPLAHQAAFRAVEFSCAACRFLGSDGASCTQKDYIEWAGTNRLVDRATGREVPASEFCSDWFERR